MFNSIVPYKPRWLYSQPMTAPKSQSVIGRIDFMDNGEMLFFSNKDPDCPYMTEYVDLEELYEALKGHYER